MVNFNLMKIWAFFSLTIFFTSCVSVPGHKAQFLNDNEMEMGSDELTTLQDNPHTYREGSQGGEPGKSGGGCGCN